jgi:2-iminoacetate synthase ThiH
MICAHKCDAERWLDLQGKVHAAGLKTNATMLYGHIESIEDRVSGSEGMGAAYSLSQRVRGTSGARL